MKSWLYYILVFLPSLLLAQDIDMDAFHGMQPRNIGPAGMSGRITAIDVVLSDPDVIYVGAAAGGVWKSENAGHTWTPIFDDQDASSIGDIKIYQANPSIIYVGTGEGNPRNSQNSGRGIYKSLDGGATWQCMGLKETRQIHRVLVHPENSDIVWAGVSGATWGESEHRGVYKSMDGGKTWRKILYVDQRTGVSDMVMDPKDPNKIIVGMWEHRRWPWTFRSGGKGSGLYITHDGGESWQRRTDKDGLPKGELGRIGLAIAPTRTDRIYAYVESKENAIYRSDDGGTMWKRVSKIGEDIGDRPFYYADIYVDTQNENRLYSIATEVTVSEDGGATWSVFAPGNKIHTDHHAWWSHPTDNEHIIIGHDGGLNISQDRGANWTFADNLPLAQFYHIRVDQSMPYNVMGGLQDNGSWRGPSRTWFKGGIRNMYWQRLSVGDGFDVITDPLDLDYGYAMGQAGNLVRWHAPSGQLLKIKPTHPDGDHLRFNWNAGIAISPIDQSTIYYGSQYLHRSEDKGSTWTIISPDLTTNDPEKTRFLETGGLSSYVTGAENHCTIFSIDPSPLDKNVLWVGTDDGQIQVTEDGGTTWQNRTPKMAGLPATTWAPQVTASTYDRGTAYVVFDDHRRDNWEPYLFKTTDFGRTWSRMLDGQDVDGYLYCFTQDPVVPRLMFVGTEFGLYVSFDEGSRWQKWTQGMPTMPVSDLVIHPRDHDLVIGTFGRAIWILDDIRPLRALALAQKEIMAVSKVHLFDPPDEHVMIIGESIGYRDGKVGDALYNGTNRPYGALLTYHMTEASGEVKIRIKDTSGDEVRVLHHKGTQGVNRLSWGLDMNAPRPPQRKKPEKEDRPRGGFEVAPGTYMIELILEGNTSRQDIVVKADPRLDLSRVDIPAKYAMIKRYNHEVSQATVMMDEVRDMQAQLVLIKDIATHNEIPESDTLYTLLDSMNTALTQFTEAVSGRTGVQGIYRDPAVLTAMIGQTGYLIDHPLAPLTANEQTAFEHMTKALRSKEQDWAQIKSRISDQVKTLTNAAKSLVLKQY